MRILCLGAGAVGGYFCGRLAQAGADVTFLVREARQKNIAEHGLRIESQYGNFAGPVQTVTAAELKGPFDVIVLTCKAYDLQSSMDAIASAVGPGTVILPLLNGVVHVDILNKRFGKEKVFGGVARIAATLAPDGTIKHLNDWRFVTFGEQDGSSTPRALALKAAFDKTSVVATLVPDIMQKMWDKLVQLATVAGMSSAMRANLGEIARTKHGIAIMSTFLERNIAIAKAEGFEPSAKYLAEVRPLFSDPASPHAASMARDIERHGPVEADHIIGFLLDRAVAHGIEPELHRFVYTHLQAYEQRRAAHRL
jgi:2-dehydropantoate 2-reductase